MHLEMPSTQVVCCIYFLTLMSNVSVEANSVDADQTAFTGAFWSGSTLFDQDASKTFQQTTKADDLLWLVL